MKINADYVDERGSLMLEFLGYGLLLQVLALSLFVQIANTQTYQLAAESMARHGMRSFVTSQVDPNETAIQLLKDFGISSKPTVIMECEPDCFTSESKLMLRVTLNSISAESVWIR